MVSAWTGWPGNFFNSFSTHTSTWRTEFSWTRFSNISMRTMTQRSLGQVIISHKVEFEKELIWGRSGCLGSLSSWRARRRNRLSTASRSMTLTVTGSSRGRRWWPWWRAASWGKQPRQLKIQKPNREFKNLTFQIHIIWIDPSSKVCSVRVRHNDDFADRGHRRMMGMGMRGLRT